MSMRDSSIHHAHSASLRIVLDTNVWRRLQDAGAVEEFRRLSK